MPQDKQSRQIGDHEFTCWPLDPFTANDLLLDLGEAFGAAGGKLDFLDGEGIDAKVDAASIARAVGEFCRNVPREKFHYMVKRLGERTSVQGVGLLENQARIDELFRGRLLDLYKWIAFALEVNYRDFFGAIVGATGLKPGSMLASISSERPNISEGNGGSGG